MDSIEIHPKEFVDQFFKLYIVHPQVPLGMPCYDFTLVISQTLIPNNSELRV